jgi:hypothetical protein
MLEARVEWPLWNEAIARNESTRANRRRPESANLRRSTVVPKWSTIGIRGQIGPVTVQLSMP